jgi:hypothetical protein
MAESQPFLVESSSRSHSAEGSRKEMHRIYNTEGIMFINRVWGSGFTESVSGYRYGSSISSESGSGHQGLMTKTLKKSRIPDPDFFRPGSGYFWFRIRIPVQKTTGFWNGIRKTDGSNKLFALEDALLKNKLCMD